MDTIVLLGRVADDRCLRPSARLQLRRIVCVQELFAFDCLVALVRVQQSRLRELN
jgi:hypothetical protein